MFVFLHFVPRFPKNSTKTAPSFCENGMKLLSEMEKSELKIEFLVQWEALSNAKGERKFRSLSQQPADGFGMIGQLLFGYNYRIIIVYILYLFFKKFRM